MSKLLIGTIVAMVMVAIGCINEKDTGETPPPTSQPTETPEIIIYPSPFSNLSKDIRDKIGGDVQYLMDLREEEKPYLKGADYYKGDSEDARMYRYLAGDVAGLTVDFDHELSEGEVTDIEESTGARFIRGKDGTSYNRDLIYFVDVPWDKIDEFANVSSVVEIESAFVPYLRIPGGGNE